jgi:hypothetical protein
MPSIPNLIFFHKKKRPKIYLNYKKYLIVKTISKKKNKVGGIFGNFLFPKYDTKI